MASFWKTEACGQTVLPDRSVLIGQKLVENAKIQKFKCDILSDFQTMWRWQKTFDAKKCEAITSAAATTWRSLEGFHLESGANHKLLVLRVLSSDYFYL